MKAKTIEQLREEFEKETGITIPMANTYEYSCWLEQKLIQPEPQTVGEEDIWNKEQMEKVKDYILTESSKQTEEQKKHIIDFANRLSETKQEQKAMKSKHTAVDWLIEQLTPSISLQQKHIDDLKEKAKEIEKEQIKDAFYSGYEDRDKFKHSDDYYDKMYERNGWQGILYLGEVDGVKIYYDSYHPDQRLTVELNKDKTEMVYIISQYDDITVFDGIKKNIILAKEPTNMVSQNFGTITLQDPYSPTDKWITPQ